MNFIRVYCSVTRKSTSQLASALTMSSSSIRAMPGYPSTISLQSALLKALALGLAAGFAVAYGLERLDNKVRSAEQVEQITGLTVLGVIPICQEH